MRFRSFSAFTLIFLFSACSSSSNPITQNQHSDAGKSIDRAKSQTADANSTALGDGGNNHPQDGTTAAIDRVAGSKDHSTSKDGSNPAPGDANPASGPCMKASGTGTCSSLFTCAQNCIHPEAGVSAQTCLNNCFAQTSPTACQDYLNYAQCYGSKCL